MSGEPWLSHWDTGGHGFHHHFQHGNCPVSSLVFRVSGGSGEVLCLWPLDSREGKEYAFSSALEATGLKGKNWWLPK